jgi:hypothetical protein
MSRAEASGIRLSSADAAIVKGMIKRGDRQHDIAAWFGVNGGRIGEISNGDKFEWVDAAPLDQLPEPGPYLSGRSAQKAIEALEKAKEALLEAISDIDQSLMDAREVD